MVRASASGSPNSYVLLARLHHPQTLDGAVSEARRATNAGWFNFVMADAGGRLVNIEGSPEGIQVQPASRRGG